MLGVLTLLTAMAGTPTSTFTLGTATETSTLPTRTATFSETATATLSESATASVSLTDSESLTKTISLSETLTLSESETLSLSLTQVARFQNNWAPTEFFEGQEVRMRVAATFTVGGERALIFDLARETFQLKVVATTSSTTVGASACNGAALSTETVFGVSEADRSAGRTLTDVLYATFTAAPASSRFVVCYQFQGGNVPHPNRNTWNLLSTTPFQSIESRTWYRVPDPTAGQYAILQLQSFAETNFTYSSTGCSLANSAAMGLCVGDHLKIVPKGRACTYEYQSANTNLRYLGSNLMNDNGIWTSTAYPGFSEGATAGGVARFGTEFHNPMYDSWDTSGNYNEFENATSFAVFNEERTGFAYAYVRLPTTVGAQYDVCFSGLEERTRVKRLGGTIGVIPLWRKLYRCTSDAAGCPTNDNDLHFTVAAERVGWSMVDLTPGTWGEIVFDDSGAAKLNTEPSTFGDVGNYWWPAGGDYFRLIPAASLGEATGSARATGGMLLGSNPKTGCWDRRDDQYAEDGHQDPSASNNLMADPTVPAENGDAQDQAGAYSRIYVPNSEGAKYFVCYRLTSSRNSGMRVLPFHFEGTGSTPAKWQNFIGRLYNDTEALVPDYYMPAGNPFTTWYMNDTREETHGPLVVEMLRQLDPVKLDSRAWDFATRNWATGETVFEDTQGSALRLVKRSEPCDFPGFRQTPETGAQNFNGGLVECNNANAGVAGRGCAGSSADAAVTTAVAFYLDLPKADAYRVCYRLRGYNWRELTPTEGVESVNDPANVMPEGFRRRGEWDSSAFRTETWTRPTLSVVERRSGMDALFLVTDVREELTAGPRGVCTNPVGCENSGDVLRLVQRDAVCNINPTNWNADLVDTHVSVYCPVAGTGTTARSGLSSVAACSLSPFAMANCGGQDCSAASADRTLLGAALVNEADLFDDVVPGDYSLSNTRSVASLLKLPAYNPQYVGSDGLVFNQYKVCYKQAGSANWLILETPYEWEVIPRHTMTVAPAAGSTLLGGELQKYTVAVPDETAAAGITFHAKLVKASAALANNNCLGAPGSTEASPFVGSTKVYRVDSSSSLTFFMTTPQEEGDYHLCMQIGLDAANHTNSWWNPGTYSVKDNGLRWFVAGGNQPTNNGLINVNLIRCSFSAGSCSSSENLDSYDTSAGKDSAKVVLVSDSCSDGSADNMMWGLSADVGVLTPNRQQGTTNLGPADGPSDVAVMKIALPTVASDARVEYKVCVRTTFATHVFGGGVDDRRWVEVAQGSGVANQLVIRDPRAGGQRSAFYTEAGLVDSWTVDTALRPVTSLFTGPAAETVAFAGASTQFVSAPASSTPTGREIGFHFHSYTTGVTEVGASNIFKLVLSKKPAARLPTKSATWGTVSQWEAVDEDDCDGPAVDSTANFGAACAAGTFGRSSLCPTLGAEVSTRMEATLHIPIVTGEFKVCYRVQHTSIASRPKPWLWLPSRTARGYGLYAHPSFLEVEVDSSKTNLTAFDTRVVSDVAANGAQVSLSSWCAVNEDDAEHGKGVRCGSQNNGGYPFDLLTIVNATQVCPAPQQSPGGSAIGEDEWFTLQRASNVTATVRNTWDTDVARMFVLPPAFDGASGQYKVCVYKAGEALAGYVDPDYVGQRVTKKGVVYQMFNRGTSASGGGSGFWRDTTGAPSRLIVERPTLVAQTGRFIEYTTTLESVYGADQVTVASVTDELTEKFSRSVLFTSGSTVRYVVRTATADGSPVPEGSYTIDVKRCPSTTTFSGLACNAAWTEPEDVAPQLVPFLAVNQGACTMGNAARYGWPSNGLRQSMVNGVATFELQYRSACPPNEFGCGVRFMANGDAWTSPAQWVNIQPRHTTSLTIDDLEVESARVGTSASQVGCAAEQTLCYLKTCWSEESCTLNLRARWMGPEFAPNGTIGIHYSDGDYPTNTDSDVVPAEVTQAVSATLETRPRLSNPVPWVQGGWFSWTFTPRLNQQFTEKHVFLNITYGTDFGSWTRVVLRVARRMPTTFAVTSIAPLDVSYGLTGSRMPSPGFKQNTGATVFTASAGSYLDALTPYRMYYTLTDASGAAIPRTPLAMTGWRLTARFDLAGSENAVRGVTSGMDNYLTSPSATSALVDPVPKYSAATSYYVDFRVYVNDNECSRFTSAGGCELEFTLQRSGSTDLQVSMVTPVRVPASTLQITTDTNSNTVREGILVTALPGTQMAAHFVYDEFHYGDIFALLNGPAPASGATNRDGVSMLADWGEVSGRSAFDICAYDTASTSNDEFTTTSINRHCDVYKYPTKEISGAARRWGARWKMVPSKPCYNCEFTFHSTWGAGPESHQAIVSQRHGVKELSWTYEPISLDCTPSETQALTVGFVAMTEGEAMVSNAFSVSVQANAKDTTNPVSYPRWRVFVDTAADVRNANTNGKTYALRQSASSIISVGVGGDSILTSALKAPNGATTFNYLYFEGTSAPATGVPEVMVITFRSVGNVYAASGGAGSRPISTRSYSCDAHISLQRADAPAVVQTVEVTSVSGGESACPAGDSTCANHYYTNIDTFRSGGFEVEVTFYNTVGGVKTVDTATSRNATIVTMGSLSTPRDSTPETWTFEQASSSFVSSDMELHSTYNIPPLERRNSITYTFGSLQVQALRVRPNSEVQSNIENGVGKVKLQYASTATVNSPVRRAGYRICAGTWDTAGLNEATNLEICTVVYLTVIPVDKSISTFIENQPAAGLKIRGSSPTCGLGPTLSSIKVFAFYSIVSIPNTRFYVYDEPVRFAVRFAETQFLVLSGSTVTNVSLTVDNNVPVTTNRQVLLNHAVLREGLKGTLAFYGRDVAATEAAPRSLVVTAEHLAETSVSVTGASTTNRYWFANPDETFAQWDVAETVALDDECPSKRHLQTVTSNYRTYSPQPGTGWRYTDGVSVGIPFPIQTLVTTTTNNNRAWTFSDTLVRVSKRSWERCNNGGALNVYSMRPSLTSDGLVARNGDLTSFLLEQGGAAVRTKMGAAVAWPMFSEPCEHCTLQLDLCYTNNADVATCLDGFGSDSTNPSDKIPLYAGRTKITKPFSVNMVESNVVDIHQQTLPAIRGGTDAHIQVGDLFTMSVESVQEFGTTTRWAMVEPSNQRWDRVIHVTSEWVDSPAAALDTRRMRYGNGAFLQNGAAKLGSTADLCSAVSPEEFSSASYRPRLTEVSGVVSFYFTRSCSKCRVMVSYTLSRTGRPTRSATFPLRAYTASTVGNAPSATAVEYNVRTCGSQWLLAGVPPVAVRRRKPFQMTVWRTDSHNMPDWDSTDASVSLTWNAAASQGNGAGAYAVPTSPAATAALTGRDTRSRDGSATVRLFITRACFKCSLSLSSKAHQLTVLTDPTQIIAIPAARTAVTQWFRNETEVGSWSFEVYAADDLGDRSYVVAGPTAFAFQPAYRIRQVSSASMALASHTQVGYSAKMTGQAVELTSLSTGEPTQELSTGTRVYNGIPTPTVTDGTASGTVGMTTVKLSDTPGVAYSVRFAVTGVTGPTYNFGEKKAPLINFSPIATNMAVDDSARATGTGCRDSTQMVPGGRCSFRAFTVARKPAARSTDRSWFLSVSPMAEPATAAAVCTSVVNMDAVDVCSVSIGTNGAGEASFEAGVATFWLEATRATEECSCVVTVTAPSGLGTATEQTFTVMLKPQKTLSIWDWSTSGTVPVLTSGSRKTARSVFNRTVALGLTAYDSDAELSGLGGLAGAWTGGRMVPVSASSMDPVGCFTCTSPLADGMCAVTISTNGDSADLSGYFADIDGTARCVLNTAAVGGLPILATDGTVTSQNPESILEVTIERPTKVQIVTQYHRNYINLESESNFSALHGRTINGEDAAVVGTGSTLTVRVLDDGNNLMAGDYHTLFTLTGTRNVGSGNGTEDLVTTLGPYTATATAGSVTFSIDADETTRLPSCQPTPGSCTHSPWDFVLEAAAPLLNGSTPFEGITITEKLYFVRKGVRLSASGKFKMGDEMVYNDINVRPEPMRWVYGFPFDLKVEARDVSGTVVSHPEDLGSTALVYLKPYAIPCLDNDAKTSVSRQAPFSNVYDTCITGGGACQHDTFAQMNCGTAGWSIDGKTSVSALELALQEGKKTVPNVIYRGLLDGEKRFLLTTTGFELSEENNNNLDTTFAKDDSFVAEIFMQRITGISLENPANGVKCPGGVCSVPAGWGDVSEPLTKFNLSVVVVDVAGDVVVGDFESSVVVSSSCASTAHVGFVGRGRTASGLVDTLTPIVEKAVAGVITFDDLEFSNNCPNMTLSFLCVSGTGDTTRSCDGKVFSTVKFNVTGTADIPTAPAPKEIQVGLVMGTFTVATFETYLEGLNQQVFEDSMATVIRKELQILDKIVLEYMCLVEDGVEITNEMRSNSSICRNYRVAANATTNANRLVQQLQQMAVAELVGKAEFQVLTTVYGEPSAVGDLVGKAVADDIANPDDSVLILAAPDTFRNVNATSITVGARDTPSPTPVPTAQPPTTPIPTTATPPATTAPPTTEQPVTTPNPDLVTLPPNGSDMLSPNKLLAVFCSLLAIVVAAL